MSLIQTVIEGTIQPDGTLVLDENPKLAPGRVTVVVRQETQMNQHRPLGDEFFQMLDQIWAGQKARSHVARTAEQVDAERKAMQDEMDDEIDGAIRLQEECRRRRQQAEGETIRP